MTQRIEVLYSVGATKLSIINNELDVNIDLSDLANGIYFIRIVNVSDELHQVQKIIKVSK